MTQVVPDAPPREGRDRSGWDASGPDGSRWAEAPLGPVVAEGWSPEPVSWPPPAGGPPAGPGRRAAGAASSAEPAATGEPEHRPSPGAELVAWAETPPAETPPAETPPAGAGRRGPRSVVSWLAGAVAAHAPGARGPEVDTAVAAGELARARALADPRAPVAGGADNAAVAAAEATVSRAVTIRDRVAGPYADDPNGDGPGRAPGQMVWRRAGLVIPVLGAAAGVGTSVTAAAIFDALDAAGVATMLVDAADPARSGLATAAQNQGAAGHTPHPDVGIAYARRGRVGFVAALTVPPAAVLSASMVPSPGWWLPDHEDAAPAVTVVDLGWDPWALAAAPLRGPAAWLEAGYPCPRPVLVTTATRPGLAHANQVLTRLQPWISAGQIASPAAVAVSGARRWPRERGGRGVAGVAAATLGPLLEHAAFLSHDPALAISGVGPRPVPDRLRRAAAGVPARWGLLDDPSTAARANRAAPQRARLVRDR